jgi:hypothetical protein
MSPPASPGGPANQDGVGTENRPDSTSSLPPVAILVNRSAGSFGAQNHRKIVFRSLFSKKKTPLSGAPAIRRMKTYSAQTGYVYQYYYEGHRAYHSAGDRGVEFAFTVSSDRRNWHTSSVFVSEPAIQSWQQSHGRELTLTERYAVAKLALFQAFDERPDPARMRDEVRVRAVDVEGIVETLGL